MKTNKPIIAAAAMLLAGVAWGQTYTSNYTFNVNAAVPDGNPVGVSSSTNLSGMAGSISSLSVTLDVTGGFNGDLYAYLASPAGQLVVLLNRVGMSSSNAFGYSDAGFNVTLTNGAPDIHTYQMSVNPAGGQLTGAWAADGRNILPNSAPGAFDAGPTQDLSSFNNYSPDGQWTLFIADLSSGGGQSTLVSWGLTVVTVPEPQTWALMAGGLGLLLALKRRRN